MSMPTADICVYTNNKKFVVSIKGIDDISTAHSMVIPCSFSTTFNKKDTFKIKNISTSPIILMPNFNNAIGSIISIF